MVPEAPLESTEHGLVPGGEGWFVLNARETRWWDREGRGVAGDFDGEPEFPFPQLGIAVYVLGPGEPMAMYHWEADQEDFLVISGEALLIVEGGERPLRAWDFVHCPPETKHAISARETVRAWSSPWERATGRAARTGAATRSTRLRFATAPASTRRPTIRSRRTRASGRANRHATARAGSRISASAVPPGRDGLALFRVLAAASRKSARIPSISDASSARSEPEGSIKGSIPTAYCRSCKHSRKKSRDLRGFCRAL